MGRRTQGDSGSAAVPPSVDVSKVSEGLGLVAGTCVSTADFANIPEVDARLALAGLSPETDPIQLTSCDNETNILPEQRSLDSLNVKTFLTKPFPAELHGWKDGLTIVRDVLKPVGILFLDDADPIIYTVQSPRRQQDAPTHDVAASLTAQLAWQGDPHLPRIRPCERARCRLDIPHAFHGLRRRLHARRDQQWLRYIPRRSSVVRLEATRAIPWPLWTSRLESSSSSSSIWPPPFSPRASCITKVTSEQQMQAMIQEIRCPSSGRGGYVYRQILRCAEGGRVNSHPADHRRIES
ncbi:hypothetical protein K466DRAFT_401046 [Polyporus arcularius HHB13444]|uniref:Uncharacterized protein n=1 Tax=Polyporus arcularius HHB13444 TaxID=1314778 RepID=A0A5C3PML6_9APHY|nr:hypothetical protein K466DRAFT_401046 [Polyporus arcularius HHB13444]